MVERIEDLNLNNAAIQRLINETLPSGTSVSKEARCVIARAASVFTIYMTSTATSLAHEENHRTIYTKNILQSLTDQGFIDFVEILEKDLQAYRKVVKDKKDNKAKRDAHTSAASSTANTSTDDAGGGGGGDGDGGAVGGFGIE